jgi:hypothetical protein
MKKRRDSTLFSQRQDEIALNFQDQCLGVPFEEGRQRYVEQNCVYQQGNAMRGRIQ